jgi:glycolate oxidase iron-sulfur subunit
VYDVLGRIPGLEIAALPDNQFCCGGAGAYSLSEPELASQMREPKLEALDELRPDYLVTTNIGCALHLKSGLATRNIEVEILHPVTLLARQLRIPGKDTADTCSDPQTAAMV